MGISMYIRCVAATVFPVTAALVAPPVSASDAHYEAMTAAMGEAIEEYGDSFTMNVRTSESNVLEYAETADAHFVMGTNVRLAVTRQRTPQFCADCEIIENVLVFGGARFATGLPAK